MLCSMPKNSIRDKKKLAFLMPIQKHLVSYERLRFMLVEVELMPVDSRLKIGLKCANGLVVCLFK